MRAFWRKEVVLLCFYCILGIALRLWIASLVPQPFINDERDYDYFAGKILQNPHFIASHSFRTYPYPLFLALVYRFVGFGNHAVVFDIQAIMDAITGILVYFLVFYGMRHRAAARIGMFVYEINPWTAGYVNVVLSEVMTTFFVAAGILCGMLFVQKSSVVRGMLFGLAVGIAAETRNAVFAWVLIPFGLTLLLQPWNKSRGAYIALFGGFILTLLYPLIANWRTYKEINVTTIDNFYAKEFFDGAIIKRLGPLAPPLPPETYQMYTEYYSEYAPERDQTYRRAIANKYFAKAWEIIMADPADYIKTRLDKMWYVWQKEAIYVYREPGFDQHKLFIYVLNQLLLILAAVGIIRSFPRRTDPRERAWMWWTIVGTIIYGTLAYSVTHAEYRLTIPFYPLLAAFGAVGLVFIIDSMKRYSMRRQSSGSPGTLV